MARNILRMGARGPRTSPSRPVLQKHGPSELITMGCGLGALGGSMRALSWMVAFASFEEWPLEAVLKRVWVDGAATFQVEFT